MSHKLAVFDMDGTILNTLDDLADSINHALKVTGFPVHTTEDVCNFVGNGIRKLVERSVPKGTSIDDINKVHEQFTEYYTLHCADKTKAYDGIYDLLTELKNAGCKTAVVSNKADYAVQKLCDEYFPNYFNIAAGEQQPKYNKKPAPDLVYLVMEKLDIAPEDTVYIGDSDVDILTAKNAKVNCISVDWGFRTREFLIENGASKIVSSAAELKKAILG